jgi:hypothetical protein
MVGYFDGLGMVVVSSKWIDFASGVLIVGSKTWKVAGVLGWLCFATCQHLERPALNQPEYAEPFPARQVEEL